MTKKIGIALYMAKAIRMAIIIDGKEYRSWLILKCCSYIHICVYKMFLPKQKCKQWYISPVGSPGKPAVPQRISTKRKPMSRRVESVTKNECVY